MRVLLINVVCGIRSTGRICTDLADQFIKNGDEVRIAYGRVDEVPEKYQKYAVRIGNPVDNVLHMLRTRILDQHGFGSVRATRRFLQWAEEYKPDLVWLHNIHGYYINVEMLFSWIKQHPEIQVKWTLHDCWAFTGHCAYFSSIHCEQWKKRCINCRQIRNYPSCYGHGNVEHNYERKKAAFTGVKDLTLITPSKWLAELTRESFLREYPVEVRYNTINHEVFQPTESDFRKKYKLQKQYIILGVASSWDKRKGLYDLYRLAQMLNENYAIVLVGLSKKQMNHLTKNVHGVKKTSLSTDSVQVYQSEISLESDTPSDWCKEDQGPLESLAVPPKVEALYEAITNRKAPDISPDAPCRCTVVCIPSTNSTRELAQIYTAADLFVNPTHEDNYPTVNLEAQACGTKVVTYDTGGCRETLQNTDFRE